MTPDHEPSIYQQSMYPDKPYQPVWPFAMPEVEVKVRVKLSATEKLLRRLRYIRAPWFTEEGTLLAFPIVRIPREQKARCAWCRLRFTREFETTIACPECDYRNVRGVLSNFEIARRMAMDARDFSGKV